MFRAALVLFDEPIDVDHPAVLVDRERGEARNPPVGPCGKEEVQVRARTSTAVLSRKPCGIEPCRAGRPAPRALRSASPRCAPRLAAS